MTYTLKDDDGETIATGSKEIYDYHPSVHYDAAWGLDSEGYMASGTTIDTSGYYYRRSTAMSLRTVYT